MRDKSKSITAISTRVGRRAHDLWAAFGQGFVDGIRPFGPAGRVLFVTYLLVPWLMLLGFGLIHLAGEIGPPIEGFLAMGGEGALLLGGVLMLAGCVCAWWRIFRESFGRAANEARATKEAHTSS